MTFRPTALAYAFSVVLAWIVCLAVALDRVELLFVALPLVVAFLRAPGPARAEVTEVRLALEPGAGVEGDDLTVTITALVPGTGGPVEILPVLPPLLAPLGAGRATVLALPSAAPVSWHGRLRCRASGTADRATVFFRISDRAGLWVGESRFEQPVSLVITPRVEAIRFLPRPRRTGAPFGIHLSRNLGDGTDFADIRPFTTGDRVKRINWPVSLRMNRLHVNRFHTESSAEIVLLVDSFINIGRRPNSSLDYTLRAAASLAVSYLRQHDRVGLIEFGGWVRWTRAAAGPAQCGTILRSLARVSVSPAGFLQDLTALSETVLPGHALIIAISPLVDERFVRTVERLAGQGRDVILLAIRGDVLSEDLISRRAASPLVRRLWSLEREDCLRALRGYGVRAVNWSPVLLVEAALQAVRRPGRARGTEWYD
jgi:uncharacterized protein (DUF58 family)